MNIEEAQNQIIKMDDYINQYNKSKQEIHGLNVLLQKASCTICYLESVRSFVHNEFQVLKDKYIDEGMSVARAENKAHIELPLMYKLRRKIGSWYECIGAMRTNISTLRSELNNLNTKNT